MGALVTRSSDDGVIIEEVSLETTLITGAIRKLKLHEELLSKRPKHLNGTIVVENDIYMPSRLQVYVLNYTNLMSYLDKFLGTLVKDHIPCDKRFIRTIYLDPEEEHIEETATIAWWEY